MQVRDAQTRVIFNRRCWILLLAVLVPIFVQACALVRPSRSSSPPPTRPSPQSASPARAQPTESKPALEQAKIKEEDLREPRSAPQSRARDRVERPIPGRETLSPSPEDVSLIAKITPQTPPQRAASLRLTEEGKKLLESGEYAKALARLERTIAIDSTNAYGYYYLAKTHYRMTRYQQSLNFLDVAESLFSNEPYWLAEVFALKGEDFRALGQTQRADSSYSQALKLNPGNRVATEGLSSLRGETQPSSR